MSNKTGSSHIPRFIPRGWHLPLVLLAFALVLRLVSQNKSETEWRYSTGIYPHISRVMRWFTGWVPFSIGDVLYFFIICYILVKTVGFIKKLFQKKITRAYLKYGGRKLLVFFLSFYILFQVLWGLNYRRQGIAAQLHLNVQRYSTGELDTVLRIVSDRLYELGDAQPERKALAKRSFLFSEAAKMYKREYAPYPFMEIRNASVKRSLFGRIGNYMGFQGYYNPLTGEAQVNTTVPLFMQPNIVCHEMAHQAGYAKENEANFVGYLAGKQSPNPCFRYSAYFDLMLYGLLEMQLRDTVLAGTLVKELHPQVREDIREWQRFRKAHKSPVEYVVMWFYGQYLKANSMPSGVATYNEVIAWLIAYYKQYGANSV